MKFEWDRDKDRQNQTKHGIGFQEAATVLGDRFALSWRDQEHSVGVSVGEYRTLTLGYTERQRLIIVSHTERDDRVRIISARLATVAERQLYESA